MAEEKVSILLEVIDKGSEELKKFEENLKKTGSSITDFAAGVAKMGAVMATAAVVGLAAMTKSAIDTADEIGKAAQKVGITTESLSGLAYAAKLSDVSFEELQGGLKKLSVAIVEAQNPTSEMANAFNALGIKTVDANGKLKASDVVLKEIATRFKNAPDDVSKTAIAMQLFGKSGANLIPLLNAGGKGLEALSAEAAKLGYIFDKETTKAAEEFNDTLTKLKVASGSMGLTIAKELLPTLQVLATAMLDAKKDGTGFSDFAVGVGEVFKFAAKSGVGLIWVIQSIGQGLVFLKDVARDTSDLNMDAARRTYEKFAEKINASALASAELMAKIDDAKRATVEETKAQDDANAAAQTAIDYKKKLAAAVEAEEKAYKHALEALLKEADGYKDLTAVQKIQQQIEKGAYSEFTEAHKKKLLEVAAEVDATRLKNTVLKETAAAVGAVINAEREAGYKTQNLADNLQQLKTAGSENATMTNELLNPLRQLVSEYGKLEQALKGVQLREGSDKEQETIQAQMVANKQAQQVMESKMAAMAQQLTTQNAINKETQNYQSYIGAARDTTKQLVEQEEMIYKWLGEGTISANEFVLAMQKLDKAKLENLKSQLTDLQKQTATAASTIQSTLGDSFLSIMQGNFKDVGTLFKNMLDKMVAEALAAQLAKSLFGDFNKTGSVSGSAGGWLTSLVSMFGTRATGGPVTAGQPYIVGEKRAEVFVPTQNGTIMPDTSSLAMSGGQSINLHVTAMDSQSVLAAIDKIKRPLAEMMSGTNRSYNLG